MNPLFTTLAMVFCHIIADFTLQGKMGDWKQKKWWKKNAPDKKYEFDYLVVLALHGFEWSFLTMLPLAAYLHFNVNVVFVIFLLSNAIAHCLVDHWKANELKINLFTDQIIHLIQIGITVAFFF